MTDDPTLDAILSEFAAHLVPEAFATATRADRVTLEPVDLTGAATDADAAVWFDRWVSDRVTDALEASWPHDRPLVVAFTSDGHLLRRYDEPGCGHLGCVTGAIRDEVTEIATPWVFGADLPRPQATWQVTYDDDGGDPDEVLVAPTERRWAAAWYAEGRGRGVAETRAGVVDLDGEVVTAARRVPVMASWAAREFHRMLFRHPSRKHHPLRGRARPDH